MNVLAEAAIAREFPRNTRVILKERYTDHSQQRSLRKFTIGYTTGKVGLYCRLQGYSVRVGRGPEIVTGDGTLMAVPAECLERDEEEK